MERMPLRLVFFVTTVVLSFARAPAETLDQVISRENVDLKCSGSSLTVGRDGMVYLCTGGNRSFVLRISRAAFTCDPHTALLDENRHPAR